MREPAGSQLLAHYATAYRIGVRLSAAPSLLDMPEAESRGWQAFFGILEKGKP